jgi:tetratricopeptide (TPR) repeat protein
MKRYCLLLLVPILLGCSVSTGRDAYERALAYVEQGDAPQALACLKEAARKATHDSLRVMVYNEMGSLLFNEGLQEQALNAYLMAYQANCRLGDTIGMAYNQADIANVYRTREADDSCVYYFDQAVELAHSQGDSLLVTDIQNQLAGYYLWHQDYGKARPLLFTGLRDSIAGGLCFMLADLYHHTGPQDSARYYCQLLLKEEDTGLRQMAHKWLAEILLAEGHTADAAQHLEQYELLTDSLMQETDTEALHRVSALYDYSQREQENARLQRRVIIIAAIAAVLLMLLLAVLLYFSRRRLQYRMKLQQLEHLLTDYRKDYTKTAERQQQILTETPICQRINRLLGDSRHPSMTDEDWHILEDTFMKVQPSFLNRLREFHRFSSHELHICLLLRLRLQPAAIGQLTAHSKQSISSTRSRLFEKVFGQKGTPAQWDEFILSL